MTTPWHCARTSSQQASNGPGTDQRVLPDEDGTAYLECDNVTMAMAVTPSPEDLQELLDIRGDASPDMLPVLHGPNWMIIAREKAPLQQLQDELGGTILPTP